MSFLNLLKNLFSVSDFDPETMKSIEPRDVRIGDKIVCQGRHLREVDVIEFMGGGRFRFIFTDDRWIEYQPGEHVTIVARES